MVQISEIASPENAQHEPSIEERRVLIERVAASDQFSRSARLRDLLLYIGGQSLKEGCPDIREQEIGVRVFGRQPSYDRSQDNIVRVNATELRKRVSAYFAGPGAQEPLLFEIPRGAYKLIFRWRQSDAEQLAPALAETPQPAYPVTHEQPATRTRMSVRERGWWALMCVVLAMACLFLWQQNRGMRTLLQPAIGQPAVSAFWDGFLDRSRETDLVLPDDSASVIEDLTGEPINLDDYLTRGFMRRIQSSPNVSSDRKYDLNQIYSHNLVTFGAVRAAQEVMREIPAGYSRYLILARNFSADQLTRGNAVLIGGMKSLPWDHVFDDQLNFITDYDYKTGVQFVRNRHPKPGEQPIYAVSNTPDNMTGYAVVAYLPNPSRTGRTIILAGTDSDATGAAAEFLTSEEKLARLRAQLHAGQFPYFEVLLKTSRVNGTFFDAEPMAYRAYPVFR